MLRITPVPAFTDNYLWVLHEQGRAVVVDPGDAGPVIEYLAAERLQLVAILCTHHHGDHVGGIEALAALAGPIPVFGPAGERIPGRTRALRGGDVVELDAPALRFEVIDVPGHTAGHIAFHEPARGLLFCGDTLFACGCGRLFEGTAQQMNASLTRLAALPGTTRFYCAHEYTLANIRFARAVEPENAALLARAERDKQRRARGEPTLPATLQEERATNPFLRVAEPAVIAAAGARAGRPVSEPDEVFAVIRDWKNHF